MGEHFCILGNFFNMSYEHVLVNIISGKFLNRNSEHNYEHILVNTFIVEKKFNTSYEHDLANKLLL